MKASTQLSLLSGFFAAAMVFAKVAEIALLPAHFAALAAFGRAVIGNVVVQAVLITVALVGLVSMCACSWDRAERRHAEHEARCAEWEAARRKAQEDLRAKGWAVLPADADTSSLLDDSPGVLPEEWPAQTHQTDRGNAA